MENHFRLTDQEFETQFENCTLDPSLFSHEAHLRLAWIHLKNYGEAKAIENICSQIAKFATNAGAPDKYHETVTVAAVKAVRHFMQKSKSQTFQDFIIEFPRLKFNFKDLLGHHYGIDIFTSEKAKKEFLEPDLLPFN